ncbi:MAG: hypothetical protein MUQ75_11435, partial [Crocinitomicaceae bacterium]|nr:hypothetical protein [Crocinitomicaceae bacterium]
LGLATIFPGSTVSVIIMGIALELGKIITVLWIHRRWKTTNLLLKIYFSIAVLILMFITSIGIFGFLSKAHIEHKNSAITESIKIDNINSQISNEKSLIERHKSQLSSLDVSKKSSSSNTNDFISQENIRIEKLKEQLNIDINTEQARISEFQNRIDSLDAIVVQTEKSNSGLFSNKKKALEELSKKQSEERDFLRKNIISCNNNIKLFREAFQKEYQLISSNINNLRSSFSNSKNEFNDQYIKLNENIKTSLQTIESLEIEKTKYGKVISDLEAEIGPLKYVAALISDVFGFSISNDQAVRLIIIIIMFVFDPLALLLLISIQSSFLNGEGSLNKTYKRLFSKASFKSLPKDVQQESDKQENKPKKEKSTTPKDESLGSTQMVSQDLPDSNNIFQKILLPQPNPKNKKLPKTPHVKSSPSNKLPNPDSNNPVVLLEQK